MEEKNRFDVIIIGGSYSGLSAALTLGRARRKVLVIDSGRPCNRYTPRSYNFITHDGVLPADISRLAKEQVNKYSTVSFYEGTATKGERNGKGFLVGVKSGASFYGSKLIFASGLRDIMPDIPGFEECWGKTVIHCPYCHGYEVRDKKTGLLGNGDYVFDHAKLISNWTGDLTLFTNGSSTLTKEQANKLGTHGIEIVEKKVRSIEHHNGKISRLSFEDGSSAPLDALYTKPRFEQHCEIAAQLGCEIIETGHLKIDSSFKTTVDGVFACGDNSNIMRTVSLAAAAGTFAAIVANKELIDETF